MQYDLKLGPFGMFVFLNALLSPIYFGIFIGWLIWG